MLHVLLLSPCQLSTAATMKSLILVAVILQLVIIGIKTDGKYEFGDIIEFPRKCIGKKPTYSHYAVYVGPESGVNIGQGDNDIFHRTGRVGKPDCKFGKLEETRQGSEDRKYNYLDDHIQAEYRTSDKIKKRIEEKKGKECGNYEVLKNNCEHLATYVRYGEALSLQKGARAKCFLKANNAKEEEIKKKYEAVMNRSEDTFPETDENNDALSLALCANDAHKQVSWWSVLSACLALFCLLSGSCGF